MSAQSEAIAPEELMADPTDPPEDGAPTASIPAQAPNDPTPNDPAPAEAAPSPAPEPAHEEPMIIAPIGRSRERPRRAARRAPPPEPQPDHPNGAADFDAVFEGRSGEGLGDRLAPTLAYLLMIISPATLGLLAVPAALIAWTSRRHAPDWLRTHYLFQLRTFFTGALLAIVAMVTEVFGQTSNVVGVVAGAGWMLLLLVGVAWFVMRATLGLGRLRRGQPIRNWRTWLI